jgi:hypothetical protein
MTTAPGAEVAPHEGQTLTGTVHPPSASPDSHTKHSFVQLIRDLVDHSTAFKDEAAVLEAHRTLTAFHHILVPPEHQQGVIKPTDRAPVEDVRLRVAPNQPIVPAAGTPVIDYALLAQYIVQAQQNQTTAQQVAPPAAPAPAAVTDGEVHVITDAQ